MTKQAKANWNETVRFSRGLDGLLMQEAIRIHGVNDEGYQLHKELRKKADAIFDTVRSKRNWRKQGAASAKEFQELQNKNEWRKSCLL